MQIVPIRDLRNTNEISERCRQSAVAMAEVYRKLMQAEAEMDAGKAIDGEAAFAALKARYR